GKIKEVCLGLEEFPDRGHVPRELAAIDVYDYLEVHYKPFRIVYQVVGKDVFVHCVLDGRRDMQELLQRRLLR
ncbi:MAG: type II toxin-antitoxin system RelE/ParE family toxin, partial [Calditrichaeota bacterium]|nr:type II toxin-antitoxin system RelE/ParE family toxin [Calditrichota bacterium]